MGYKDIVRVSETCVIFHSMLVGVSQNNLFANESFCISDTQALVGHCYDDALTCVGAEVVPAPPSIDEDYISGDSGDASAEETAAVGKVGLFSVPFRAMFQTAKRMKLESEHITMRTGILHSSSTHDA